MIRFHFKLNHHIIISLLLVCFCCIAIHAEEAEMVVNVLSVGHGDAIFIEFPNGMSMLVDGGNVSYGSDVTSFIKDKGYTYLDYLVLTHTHDDHVGGLIHVLDDFNVGQVWMSVYQEETPLFLEFMSKLELKALPISYVARTDSFVIGEVTIAILNPPEGNTLNQLGGPNGASIAMHLTYGNTSILLSADIDINTDRKLIKLYGDHLKSTVLKCAHHGSESSNSQEFLATVSPQIAVVSTGPSQYNYPSQITMSRIKKVVPEVYRTDIHGTVIIATDGDSIKVETQ